MLNLSSRQDTCIHRFGILSSLEKLHIVFDICPFSCSSTAFTFGHSTRWHLLKSLEVTAIDKTKQLLRMSALPVKHSHQTINYYTVNNNTPTPTYHALFKFVQFSVNSSHMLSQGYRHTVLLRLPSRQSSLEPSPATYGYARVTFGYP